MDDKVFKEFNDLNELIEALGLSKEPDKTCALKPFIQALDFIKQTREFKMSDIQRYLKCGYGTACKVVDALCSLCVVEKDDFISPHNYISLLKDGLFKKYMV